MLDIREDIGRNREEDMARLLELPKHAQDYVREHFPEVFQDEGGQMSEPDGNGRTAIRKRAEQSGSEN